MRTELEDWKEKTMNRIGIIGFTTLALLSLSTPARANPVEHLAAETIANSIPASCKLELSGETWVKVGCQYTLSGRTHTIGAGSCQFALGDNGEMYRPLHRQVCGESPSDNY